VIAQFIFYERPAADAIERRSEELSVEALAIHPWVKSGDYAVALARTIVSNE